MLTYLVFETDVGLWREYLISAEIVTFERIRRSDFCQWHQLWPCMGTAITWDVPPTWDMPLHWLCHHRHCFVVRLREKRNNLSPTLRDDFLWGFAFACTCMHKTSPPPPKARTDWKIESQTALLVWDILPLSKELPDCSVQRLLYWFGNRNIQSETLFPQYKRENSGWSLWFCSTCVYSHDQQVQQLLQYIIYHHDHHVSAVQAGRSAGDHHDSAVERSSSWTNNYNIKYSTRFITMIIIYLQYKRGGLQVTIMILQCKSHHYEHINTAINAEQYSSSSWSSCFCSTSGEASGWSSTRTETWSYGPQLWRRQCN